ncbi:MAG: YggT family protein [Actinomycetales bacterium]|jgi:YggT family protein
MSSVGQLLATILWLYWLLFVVRLILDLIQGFARDFRPRGPLLVLVEGVFTLTDPPLRLLRRFIPPLRLGAVQFDMAFLIVLVGLQILTRLALLL